MMIASRDVVAILKKSGREISVRRLTSWRAKELLPRLSVRGRGRGKGKFYFWRNPTIIAQASAIYDLMNLQYPAELARQAIFSMGYPVEISAVRCAWKFDLRRTDMALKKMRGEVRRRRGASFYTPEDELSAIATPFARQFSREFQIDYETTAQPIIDSFAITFAKGDDLDIDYESFERLATILLSGFGAVFIGKSTAQADLQAALALLRVNTSLPAVEKIMGKATIFEVRQAQRMWRRILGILAYLAPKISKSNASSLDLPMGAAIAAKLGNRLIPMLVRFIQIGNKDKIEQTIREIGDFIFSSKKGDLSSIIDPATMTAKFKLEMRQLLARLEDIWDWHGFPFRRSKELP